MGYKTTVHIGMVSDSWFPGDGKQKWLRELMVFELFKIGDSKLGQLFDKYNELPSAQKVFFFASNGNTKIKKDRYGDELVAVPF